MKTVFYFLLGFIGFGATLLPAETYPVAAAPIGRVQKSNGIDFWSFGYPNRKYQVLAIIEDRRYGYDTPPLEFYSTIASKTKAAGGNAAIILNITTTTRGSSHLSGSNFSWQPRAQSVATVQLIKYLP